MIELLGNRARSEIVRTLSRRGPLTATEIAAAVGVARSRAHVHISALEDQGIITGDIDPRDRTGRTVRWTVDTAALSHTLEELGNYLRGH